MRRSDLFAPLGIYLLWTIGTYLLEGRINLLQEPTPAGRTIYILVTNIIIGTVIALWILGSRVRSGALNEKQIGAQPAKRTVAVSLVAVMLGFGFFLLQKPVSLNPLVVWNVFSQVLPVTIAEVVVC
ncbi:hypothetical protein [Methanomethylovorans sp. PtaU1.Bin093]|uniref:hypothetical protein n=1 Tax=Methanomethylovorans sp. PtaU1.Bin093 TaxID=1811679 RepID=UPI0025D21E8A|nr:hypothetical protein [Methanomethylovorans sp. PtaU1.Bin093]